MESQNDRKHHQGKERGDPTEKVGLTSPLMLHHMLWLIGARRSTRMKLSHPFRLRKREPWMWIIGPVPRELVAATLDSLRPYGKRKDNPKLFFSKG